MTRDPNSYIQASADALAETLLSKNSDYAPTGEFSNFEKAEEISGVRVMQIINAQIAIKMTRLQSLWIEHETTPKNESIMDSYLDLAGYAIIGHAYLTQLRGTTEYVLSAIEDRETIRNSADDECFHSWVQVGNDISECGCCGAQRHG